MFKKPFQTTGNSLLKNKDVKKLRCDLIEKYPGISQDELFKILPSKASIIKVKFQAPSRIVVYQLENEKNPLFFDLSGRGDLYPTVYTLWKYPEFLPSLLVQYPVSEYLMKGADLMLPGVRASPEMISSYRQGEIRCVIASGNPMPFALGEMLVSGETISHHGMIGKGLKIVHVFKDFLWEMGTKEIPNDGFQEKIIFPVESLSKCNDDQNENGNEMKDQNENESEIKNQRNEDLIERDVDQIELPKEESNLFLNEEKDGNLSEVNLTLEEMDNLMKQSFLNAIKTCVKSNQLPLLVSHFYSNMMLPSRPAGSCINLKKSSYKKISIFLEAMKKQGILELSIDTNGAQWIKNINFTHVDITSFKKFLTADQAEEETKSNIMSTKSLKIIPGEHIPQVLQLFKPNALMKRVFEEMKSSQTYFTIQEVTHFFNKYIKENNMIHAQNSRMIVLDPVLTDVLFEGMKKTLGGVYPTEMNRDDGVKQFLSRFQKYHAIKLHPDHIPKVKAGDVKNILIHAERKMGNKKMTVIRNVESFGVDPVAFVQEAQKKFACSVTYQKIEEGKENTNIEILLQGQFVEEVEIYLSTHFKIPKKYFNLSYGKGVSKKKR